MKLSEKIFHSFINESAAFKDTCKKIATLASTLDEVVKSVTIIAQSVLTHKIAIEELCYQQAEIMKALKGSSTDLSLSKPQAEKVKPN